MIYMATRVRGHPTWKVASDGVSMDAQSYWIIDGFSDYATANLGAGHSLRSVEQRLWWKPPSTPRQWLV